MAKSDRFVPITELKALGFDYDTHAGKVCSFCLLCSEYRYHYYVAPRGDSQNFWLAVCDSCNRYHDRGEYISMILRILAAKEIA